MLHEEKLLVSSAEAEQCIFDFVMITNCARVFRGNEGRRTEVEEVWITGGNCTTLQRQRHMFNRSDEQSIYAINI